MAQAPQSSLTSWFMQLCEVYRALGEARLRELLKGISMSRLRTYQMYERLRVRCHLTKLNTETLRKSESRLWERMEAGDEDLAQDLAQSILISQMPMIIQVLNHLGVPHEEGFFGKDVDPKKFLTGEWRQQAYEAFREKYPPAVLLFYLNHLGAESGAATDVYVPAEQS